MNPPKIRPPKKKPTNWGQFINPKRLLEGTKAFVTFDPRFDHGWGGNMGCPK